MQGVTYSILRLLVYGLYSCNNADLVVPGVAAAAASSASSGAVMMQVDLWVDVLDAFVEDRGHGSSERKRGITGQ